MKFASDTLRAELARRNVVYSELAEALKVHPNTVGNWVNGRAAPKAFDLIRTLQFIGYTGDDLRAQRLIDWYIPDENGNGPG